MRARNRFSPRVPVVCDTSVLPDRAKQSMKDQCDINFIMGRYLKSGNVDWLAKHAPSYGDIEPIDFHQAMGIVAKAKESFADLPSDVRKRFSQSPAEFLAFCHDGANLDEARRLGLAPPAAPVAPAAPSSGGGPGGASPPAASSSAPPGTVAS